MAAGKHRSTESQIYRGLRTWNDLRAVANGHVGRRVARRAYGRAAGRLAGKLFG